MQPSGPFAFDEDGTFVSGAFSGFGATANNSQFTSNRSITTDYSAGFKWHAGDHLKINGDFQYVDATAENRSFTAFPQRDSGTLSIDLSGKLPPFQFGPADRKSVVSGKSVSVRVELGGSGNHKKK